MGSEGRDGRQHHPPSPPALGASIPPYPQQHPWSTDTPQDMTEEKICPCWRDTGNSHGVLEECQRNREALGALRERFSALQAQLYRIE